MKNVIFVVLSIFGTIANSTIAIDDVVPVPQTMDCDTAYGELGVLDVELTLAFANLLYYEGELSDLNDQLNDLKAEEASYEAYIQTLTDPALIADAEVFLSVIRLQIATTEMQINVTQMSINFYSGEMMRLSQRRTVVLNYLKQFCGYVEESDGPTPDPNFP